MLLFRRIYTHTVRPRGGVIISARCDVVVVVSAIFDFRAGAGLECLAVDFGFGISDRSLGEMFKMSINTRGISNSLSNLSSISWFREIINNLYSNLTIRKCALELVLKKRKFAHIMRVCLLGT